MQCKAASAPLPGGLRVQSGALTLTVSALAICSVPTVVLCCLCTPRQRLICSQHSPTMPLSPTEVLHSVDDAPVDVSLGMCAARAGEERVGRLQQRSQRRGAAAGAGTRPAATQPASCVVDGGLPPGVDREQGGASDSKREFLIFSRMFACVRAAQKKN